MGPNMRWMSALITMSAIFLDSPCSAPCPGRAAKVCLVRPYLAMKSVPSSVSSGQLNLVIVQRMIPISRVSS